MLDVVETGTEAVAVRPVSASVTVTVTV